MQTIQFCIFQITGFNHLTYPYAPPHGRSPLVLSKRQLINRLLATRPSRERWDVLKSCLQALWVFSVEMSSLWLITIYWWLGTSFWKSNTKLQVREKLSPGGLPAVISPPLGKKQGILTKHLLECTSQGASSVEKYTVYSSTMWREFSNERILSDRIRGSRHHLWCHWPLRTSRDESGCSMHPLQWWE